MSLKSYQFIDLKQISLDERNNNIAESINSTLNNFLQNDKTRLSLEKKRNTFEAMFKAISLNKSNFNGFDQKDLMNLFKNNKLLKNNFFNLIYAALMATKNNRALISNVTINQPGDSIVVIKSNQDELINLQFEKYKSYINNIPVSVLVDMHLDRYFDDYGDMYNLADLLKNNIDN